MTNAILITNLSKSYGETVVFRNFSARLPLGETTVITGVSGGGKTTLLRLILGLETPDGGEIAGVPARRAAVFQEDRLCPQLTALENVLLAAGRKKEREARDLLARLGLGESLAVPAAELSGGMRRRCALARALCAESDLLVLDEPFKGLDEATLAATLACVDRWLGDRTFLLVTHSPQEAERLGCRITRLDELTRTGSEKQN